MGENLNMTNIFLLQNGLYTHRYMQLSNVSPSYSYGGVGAVDTLYSASVGLSGSSSIVRVFCRLWWDVAGQWTSWMPSYLVCHLG